jgi:hypothetical protein
VIAEKDSSKLEWRKWVGDPDSIAKKNQTEYLKERTEARGIQNVTFIPYTDKTFIEPGAKPGVTRNYECGPESGMLKVVGNVESLDQCNEKCKTEQECRYFSFENNNCKMSNSCTRVVKQGQDLYTVPLGVYTQKTLDMSEQAGKSLDVSTENLEVTVNDLKATTESLAAATESLQTATSVLSESSSNMVESPETVALAAEVERLNAVIASADALAEEQTRLLLEKESIINDTNLSLEERDRLLNDVISRLKNTTTKLEAVKGEIDTSKATIDVQVERIKESTGFINSIITTLSDIYESLFG